MAQSGPLRWAQTVSPSVVFFNDCFPFSPPPQEKVQAWDVHSRWQAVPKIHYPERFNRFTLVPLFFFSFLALRCHEKCKASYYYLGGHFDESRRWARWVVMVLVILDRMMWEKVQVTIQQKKKIAMGFSKKGFQCFWFFFSLCLVHRRTDLVVRALCFPSLKS